MFDEDDEDDDERKEFERRKRQLAQVFTDMIETPEGRTFLYGLLKMCMVLGESSFASCPRVQAYNEGKREIGAYIFKSLENTVPELLYKMLLEGKLQSNQFNK